MKRIMHILSVGTMVCCTAAAALDAPGFRQLCAQRAAAADAAGTMTIAGRDGWMFLAGELRHISVGKFTGAAAQTASKATKPEWRDPLPAILDFKAGLDRVGIELLIVPVPPKAVVYPDMLCDESQASVSSPTRRLDAADREFYDLLRANHVAVLDLMPAFVAARSDEKGAAYCRQDSHWSGCGCEIAARQIADAVKDRPWLTQTEKLSLDCDTCEMVITGDLWDAATGTKPPKETLRLRFVGQKKDGVLEPVKPDKNSPVILLGDSHTLVFHAGADMHARGAGLADQLALECGFPVDLIGVRGSGATPARINLFRRGRSDPHYFDHKKLVIWCFSAREFTEAASGWRNVPVTR